MRDGKLLTWMTSEQCRLERAIADAAASPPVAGQVFVRLSRGHNDTALAAFVAPLNIADEELLTLNAKVLVIIHDTDARGCAKTEMLTSLYGLTDAEARLASALSGGHSIESAAALLNIRPATARSELKSVFRKTGVSRQQDLVRLLTALASVSKA
jgi:DNA-binding CsgD family transcriptional regulator